MRRLPPLTGLRAFESAARHLSFKAAAGELGVTPTAISHQIKSLEVHCGQPLFRRRPRPLSLTAAGERLFPVLRDGFDRFADALASMRGSAAGGRLRITTTNAFAARWLVPRLPHWRQSHPRLRLDIVGTDSVLDLRSGEADLAIRYARTPPSDGSWIELERDRFVVVGAPTLVGSAQRLLTPRELTRFPLVEAEWPPTDVDAPTWLRWEALARLKHRSVPRFAGLAAVSFREELHAIDAVISGQGIGLCSDVLVRHELANGTLVRLSNVTVPGYGFYIVYRPDHRKEASIKAFASWARSASTVPPISPDLARV